MILCCGTCMDGTRGDAIEGRKIECTRFVDDMVLLTGIRSWLNSWGFAQILCGYWNENKQKKESKGHDFGRKRLSVRLENEEI